MPGADWLELRTAAAAENVALARVTVAAFAARLPFTVSEMEELKVAVSEAVSNSVLHAYPQGEGEVVISVSVEDGELIVEVADQGIGIEDVDRARQASFSTDPERMGLGFTFMETFTDSLRVSCRRHGQGTTVVMTKRPVGPDSG